MTIRPIDSNQDRLTELSRALTDLPGMEFQRVRHAVYTVTPPPGTPVVVNPVTAPIPGVPGTGGVPEYYFPSGTPPGSVGPPAPLH
jgi:hypothetical protein